MNCRNARIRLLLAACGTALALAARPVLADTWDNSAGTALWSTASNWADNTEPTINDFVTFPNTIPGGQSTITLVSGEFAQSLTFLNNYTLTGGNIQLGNGTISLGGGWNAAINTVLAGAGPLTFSSGGTATLGASSNSYTGGTIISGTGTTVVARSNSQLGFITAPITLNGGRLRLDGSSNPTFIMRRAITPGPTGGTIDLVNTAFLDLNTALGANANTLTFTGTTGTAELNSTTTRTGATVVNGPLLRLNNANAAGSGQITLQGGGTLELANNITFAAPVLMNTGTTLRGGTGSSTFNGTCTIPSAAAVVALNGGPTSSDTLTLGTNLASVWNGSGTTQVNVGTVLLRAANNYTGSWQIAGNLQIDDSNALGTGTTPIQVNGSGRLRINAPLLSRDLTLNNPGGGLELLQDATIVGDITIPSTSSYVPFIGTARELTLAFADSTLSYGGTAFFGGASGIGSFRVSGGADVTGRDTRLNGLAGGPARITVSGSGSTWTNTGEMWIGNGALAQLLVEAGGAVSCPGVYVGVVGPGAATVTGEGSSLSSTAILKVGLASQSTMSVLAGADVTAQDTFVGDGISAAGTLTVSGAGSTWTNLGLLRVGKSEPSSPTSASGAVGISGGGTLSCLGLQIGDGATASGTFTISGGAARLDVGAAGVLMSQNGASSTLSFPGGLIDIRGNITDAGPGSSTMILDGATLDMHNSAIGGASPIDDLRFRSGTLKNVAEINSGAGLTKTGPGTLFLNTSNTYTGSTLVSEGTLFVVNLSGSATGPGPVQVSPEGTLAGPGRIAGPLNTNGHVAPAGFIGIPFGTLTVENNYNQSLGGRLHVEIASLGGFDRVEMINGGASLDGTLRVTLLNGFMPAAGDAFEFLSATAISGEFSTTDLPALPSGLEWMVEYLPTSVRLVVNGSCPQDFNHDGSIDPDDLGDLINCYFAVPPGGCERADFNGDGEINPDDLGDFLNVYFGPAC